MSCFAFSPQLWAQQVLSFDYDEYNVRNGLSQNTVLCIAQDSRGFLWFGTEDGLNRFDGYDFKVFRHRENDETSIVSNEIRTLLIDGDDLWIGTNNGVCRMNLTTQRVYHYPVNFTDDTKLNGAYVSAIKKKADGSVWISYVGSGVDVIHPEKNEVIHYTIHRDDEFRLANDMVSSLVFLSDKYTLFGTYDGLELVDDEGVVPAEKAKRLFPWLSSISGSVKSMALSKSSTMLWIGTEVNGLYRIDLRTQQISVFNTGNSELTSNDILTVCEDDRGNLWVGSDAIYVFDPKKKTVTWFNQYGMYIKSHTYAIMRDRDGNMWMGTSRLGIRKLNRQDSFVRHYHSNQGENSIKSDEVLAFQEDNAGRLWVAMGGAGLAVNTADRDGFIESPVNAKFGSQVIKSICKDRNGSFWMGTWEGGLIKYHPQTQKVEQFNPKNGLLQSHHVWDVAIASHETLWLGTLRNGLCRYSPTRKSSTYFKYSLDSTSVVNNDVISLLMDSRGILWVGTGNGLSVLYPGDSVFKNFFKFKTNEKFSLSNNVILTICEDRDGRVWLGTKGGGTTVVSVKGRNIAVEKIIKESDGLPGGTVNGILEDDKGFIWLSTNNGIAKIDPGSFSTLNLPPSVAMAGVEFLPNSRFRASNGALYFGSSRGFYTFHPDSIAFTEKPINIEFTSLKIINDIIEPGQIYRERRILDKTITDTEELYLNHTDYAITLTFSPLRYDIQEKITYSYLLENMDKDWQYTSADKRLVHYTNLQPGRYVLHVKASIDGNNWPSEAKTLVIHVSPPWWSAWWFKAAGLVLASMFLLFLYKGRIRFLKKQSHKLEGLVAMRTKELYESNREIQVLLKELAEQKEKIEIKNRELEQSHGEIVLQRDELKTKSKDLQKTRDELQVLNANLEIQVEKRTKVLNRTLSELETFLYRASHDLQGPISTLYGLLSVANLELKNLPTHNPGDYYEKIGATVSSLDVTLKKLLYKHTIQRFSLTPEYFDRSSFANLLTEIKGGIKGYREGDFNACIGEGINFRSDRSLLTILLSSLLENAFTYSSQASNKSVRLHIEQKESNLMIEVNDNGIGIQPELQEEIYNMFYRGTEISDGNGLGLYLVKDIIEKLNGEIILKTRVHEFCCFTIILPEM